MCHKFNISVTYMWRVLKILVVDGWAPENQQWGGFKIVYDSYRVKNKKARIKNLNSNANNYIIQQFFRMICI